MQWFTHCMYSCVSVFSGKIHIVACCSTSLSLLYSFPLWEYPTVDPFFCRIFRFFARSLALLIQDPLSIVCTYTLMYTGTHVFWDISRVVFLCAGLWFNKNCQTILISSYTNLPSYYSKWQFQIFRKFRTFSLNFIMSNYFCQINASSKGRSSIVW
jgi:hypothetical protein